MKKLFKSLILFFSVALLSACSFLPTGRPTSSKSSSEPVSSSSKSSSSKSSSSLNYDPNGDFKLEIEAEDAPYANSPFKLKVWAVADNGEKAQINYPSALCTQKAGNTSYQTSPGYTTDVITFTFSFSEPGVYHYTITVYEATKSKKISRDISFAVENNGSLSNGVYLDPVTYPIYASGTRYELHGMFYNDNGDQLNAASLLDGYRFSSRNGCFDIIGYASEGDNRNIGSFYVYIVCHNAGYDVLEMSTNTGVLAASLNLLIGPDNSVSNGYELHCDAHDEKRALFANQDNNLLFSITNGNRNIKMTHLYVVDNFKEFHDFDYGASSPVVSGGFNYTFQNGGGFVEFAALAKGEDNNYYHLTMDLRTYQSLGFLTKPELTTVSALISSAEYEFTLVDYFNRGNDYYFVRYQDEVICTVNEKSTAIFEAYIVGYNNNETFMVRIMPRSNSTGAAILDFRILTDANCYVNVTYRFTII